MPPLDGHYRHRGVAIAWDDAGVSLMRRDRPLSATVGWDQIDGARQIGERPGYVQLIVRGHVPPADLAQDLFAIAVNSDPDAKRLLTVIGWRAAAARAERLGGGGPRAGAPRAGAPRAGAPRAGAPRAGGPGWFRPRAGRG